MRHAPDVRHPTADGPSGDRALPDFSDSSTLRLFDFLLVTPVLDGWPRIRATVASVRQQTTRDTRHTDDIPADSRTSDFGLRTSDFRTRHVIQLSDRSTDPSGAWLRDQPGLECFVEADTGLYDAISRGFGKGGDGSEILSWLNSDEQLLPGALARVAEEFRRHPEADVVFGDYLLLDADGRPTAWRREIPAHGWLLRNGVNSVLSCATFFRRRVWEKLGGFDPDFSLVADKDFYLRAIAAGFRFRHIRAPIAAYANTGDNATLRHPLLALREQARLRAKAGAHGLVVRRFARGLRCLLKLVHGCYGRRLLRTTLFDAEGRPVPIQERLGTRWEDPADAVARRRILPSLSRRLAFTALGFAAIAARLLRPRRGAEEKFPHTLPPLLLLEPYGLGDAIALQPLVRALCEAGRSVRVATRRAWFPVFPPHPNLTLIEAVPPWAARDDRAKYRRLLARTRPVLAALRPYAVGAIGIDPRGDIRSVLALHLAGCARVETLTHYYTANDCRVMPGAAHVRHAIVRTVPRWQLNGVFALDLDLSPPDLRFLLPHPQTGNGKRETGNGRSSPCIALLPMTPWIGKRWLPERWREVVLGLRKRGAEPFVLCGPGEEEEVAAEFDGADVPLRPCPDIAAWAAALSGASAAIAVNTGPMHLASAIGIPVILLEGSSRQPLWQPPCRPFAIVSHQAETPCAPCHQVGDCRRCGRRCMAAITANEVLGALDGLNVL